MQTITSGGSVLRSSRRSQLSLWLRAAREHSGGVNESAEQKERGSNEKVSVGKAEGRVYNAERRSCQACLIMII